MEGYILIFLNLVLMSLKKIMSMNKKIISIWIALGIVFIGSFLATKILSATNDVQTEQIVKNMAAIVELERQINELRTSQ